MLMITHVGCHVSPGTPDLGVVIPRSPPLSRARPCRRCHVPVDPRRCLRCPPPLYLRLPSSTTLSPPSPPTTMLPPTFPPRSAPTTPSSSPTSPFSFRPSPSPSAGGASPLPLPPPMARMVPLPLKAPSTLTSVRLRACRASTPG